MAVMIPSLDNARLESIKSKAERELYTILRDNLGSSYLVFFELEWIQKSYEGECDLIICHPNKGILCIEVKGGGINYEPATDKWSSTDISGVIHDIKDPIKQVKNAKFSILRILSNHQCWTKLNLGKVNIGHAVFFNDIRTKEKIQKTNLPHEILGINSDLTEINKWVDGCYKYWADTGKNLSEISNNGISAIRQIFAKSFSENMEISKELMYINSKRVDLTEQQFMLLNMLKNHNKALITGGAGTGKTLLAIEKAKQLASLGLRTLFTCYNRSLSDYFNQKIQNDNLVIMNIHQVAQKFVDKYNKDTKRDIIAEMRQTYPGEEYYDLILPVAFMEVIEELNVKFEAIVCDEGQDINEEFYCCMSDMLIDSDESTFYIFYDNNQNIFKKDYVFPIDNEPYVLSRNCRNTNPIHEGAYNYYHGVETISSDITGKAITYFTSDNTKKQTNYVRNELINLLNEGVNPNKITLLVADSINKEAYINLTDDFKLPQNIKFSTNLLSQNECIKLATIKTFKGLESEIVFLWGIDNIKGDELESLLYVGMSRAISLLYVVTNTSIGTYIDSVRKSEK